MQRCTTCGSAYDESIDECPRDGTPLFATQSEVYEDDPPQDSDTETSVSDAGTLASSRETTDDEVLTSDPETTDRETADDEAVTSDQETTDDGFDDIGEPVANPEKDAVGDPTVIIPQLDQETLETLAQASGLEFEALAEEEAEREAEEDEREAEEDSKDPEPQSSDEEEARPRKQRERIAQTQMGAPAIMSDSLDEESDPYPVALSDAAIPETPPTPEDSPTEEPESVEVPEVAASAPEARPAAPFDDFSEEHALAETLPGTDVLESNDPQLDMKQESQTAKDPSALMLALVFVLVFAATLTALIFLYVL